MTIVTVAIRREIDDKIRSGSTFEECQNLIRMSFSGSLKNQATRLLDHRLANGYFELSIKEAKQLRPGLFKKVPKVRFY